MARVFKKWTCTVAFLDKGGDVSNKTYELVGADYDAASTNAISLVTDLQNVSAAAIIGYTVGGQFAEDALVLPTIDAARNSMQAIITVNIADNPLKKATLTIPAPLGLVFVSPDGENSDIVNATNSFVLALVANFQAAAQTAYISDGETVDAAPGIKGVRRTVYRRLAKG